MNKIRYYLMGLLLACFAEVQAQSFVTVENGKLYRDGKPYTFIGANYWYGAILGSKGRGGDRKRLNRELDELKRLGITNLRILVGSDGEEGIKWKVSPVLQPAPSMYNDAILDGLDYLMMQLQRRGMVAVLYLNNSWEWSGGYGFYLEHAGAGKALQPNEVGYSASIKYASLPTSRRKNSSSITFVLFLSAPIATPRNAMLTTPPSCHGRFVTSHVPLISPFCHNSRNGWAKLLR